MAWSEFVALVGLPVARSVLGWFENYSADGFTPFEWGKLAETVIRVGTPAILLYYGINGIPGMEVSAFTAAAAAFIGDLVASWITKLKSTE